MPETAVPDISAEPDFRPRRLRVMVRQEVSTALNLAVTLGAVAAGLAISALILVGAGVPPGKLAEEFILNTLFDEQSFKAVLAQHGASVLPDPPIEFPPWLQDLRQRWVVEPQ